MKQFNFVLISVAFIAFNALSAVAAEMADMPGMKKEANQAAAGQIHKGQGTVNRVDANAGKINLSHGPIPSLNWPGMTMDFRVKDKSILKKIQPGMAVNFELEKTSSGAYQIIQITPSK